MWCVLFNFGVLDDACFYLSHETLSPPSTMVALIQPDFPLAAWALTAGNQDRLTSRESSYMDLACPLSLCLPILLICHALAKCFLYCTENFFGQNEPWQSASGGRSPLHRQSPMEIGIYQTQCLVKYSIKFTSLRTAVRYFWGNSLASIADEGENFMMCVRNSEVGLECRSRRSISEL